MLHFASTAKVVKPLALEAGVLPDSATGVGVAQTHGCVCEPSRIGPPRTWFVIVRLAHGRPLPLPFESAISVFAPATMPVTTPRNVRALSSATNEPPTSVPFRVSVTFFIGTVFGTVTSTSALPSLIRSARFDNVRISKLNGGRFGCAAAGVAAGASVLPPPQPARIDRATAGAARHAARRVRVLMSLLGARAPSNAEGVHHWNAKPCLTAMGGTRRHPVQGPGDSLSSSRDVCGTCASCAPGQSGRAICTVLMLTNSRMP